jgi:D-3-phosphoglycerate dehydrogenase / 2-oxoglutarate reductase
MELKTCKVLVTATSFGKNDPEMKRRLEASVFDVTYNTTKKPLSSAELKSKLPGIHGLIAGVDVIDRAALEAADCLRVIARYGVGVDRVDLIAAREKGIVVTNTPGANSASVADLTIGLILSLARHIPEAAASTRTGGWPRLAGVTLEGKAVGLVGLGAIGKQVARRLVGFDCRILAFDPYPDLEFARRVGVGLVSLEEVLAKSDFLSLHLPLLPETRGLVGREMISRMKTGAFLINTARGELVNELALVEALSAGTLAGAALDVFSEEPPNPQNPLLSLPNVIVTPHCASHTDGALNAMGWAALEDCQRVLRGEAPKHPVL